MNELEKYTDEELLKFMEERRDRERLPNLIIQSKLLGKAKQKLEKALQHTIDDPTEPFGAYGQSYMIRQIINLIRDYLKDINSQIEKIEGELND